MRTRFRLLVAALLSCAGIYATASLLPMLRWNTSLQNLLAEGSKSVERYADFDRSFGTDVTLLVVVQDSGNPPIFNARTLRYLDSILQALRNDPAVDSVISAANLESFDVKKLFGQLVPLPPYPLVPKDRDSLTDDDRHRLSEDPILRQGFLSSDGRSTACWITLKPALRSSANYLAEAERVAGLIPRPGVEEKQLRTYITGSPLFQSALLGLLWNDGLKMMLGAVLVIALGAMLGGLRSISSIAFVLAWPPITAILCAWLKLTGRPLHLFSNNLLPLLLMNSGATLVYVGRVFGREGRYGKDVRATLGACTMTTVTTAVGFGTLWISPLRPLASLGVEAAIGTLVSFAITTFFLWWVSEPQSSIEAPKRATWLFKLPAVPRPVLALVLLVSLPWFLLHPGRIGLMGDFLDYLPKDHRRVADAVLAKEALGAQNAFEVIVALKDSEHEQQLKDPSFYLKLVEFEQEMLSVAGDKIPIVLSPVTLLSYINARIASSRGEHDASQFQVTTESAEFAIRWLIGPYLAITRNNSEQPLEGAIVDAFQDKMHQLFAITGDRLRFGCRIPALPPHEVFSLARTLETTVFPKYQQLLGAESIYTTGYSLLVAETAFEVRKTESRSLIYGGIALAVLLLFVLRNVRLWLLTLFTNLMAVSGVATLLWIFRAELNLYSTVLTATLLGILVDDSIQLLMCYRRLMNGAKQPIRAAVDRMGPPIALSSLCLAAGFSLFFLSSLPVYRQFAWTAIAGILIALYWDLWVLPRLMRRFLPASDETPSPRAKRGAMSLDQVLP